MDDVAPTTTTDPFAWLWHDRSDGSWMLRLYDQGEQVDMLWLPVEPAELHVEADEGLAALGWRRSTGWSDGLARIEPTGVAG